MHICTSAFLSCQEHRKNIIEKKTFCMLLMNSNFLFQKMNGNIYIYFKNLLIKEKRIVIFNALSNISGDLQRTNFRYVTSCFLLFHSFPHLGSYIFQSIIIKPSLLIFSLLERFHQVKFITKKVWHEIFSEEPNL